MYVINRMEYQYSSRRNLRVKAWASKTILCTVNTLIPLNAPNVCNASIGYKQQTMYISQEAARFNDTRQVQEKWWG